MAPLPDEAREKVEQVLGYVFEDADLIAEALTHASVAQDRLRSNERMEFLGDAILGSVVCEHLYRSFPEDLEGELTKIKSAVVSRHTCAQISKKLGLTDFLLLGKGMSGTVYLARDTRDGRQVALPHRQQHHPRSAGQRRMITERASSGDRCHQIASPQTAV